ncbi:MAG: rhodanese-like domain-containing protein [Hyphomicrobiaceae bacterium]
MLRTALSLGRTLLASLALLWSFAAAAQTSVLSAIDAQTAALAGKVVLIDIRSPPEWKETGVPASAYAITMHQKRDALLAALVQVTGGSKTQPIALICATGSRSSFLSGWLKSQGYTNISDVAEGVMGGRNGKGWIKSGLPLRKWEQGKSAPGTPPAARSVEPGK